MTILKKEPNPMIIHHRKCHVVVGLLLLTTRLLYGQVTKRIEANKSRPLWNALDKLEITNPGIAINYEDPPYENAADVQDSATPEQKAKYPGIQFIVPRAGHVSADVTLPITIPMLATEITANVELLLASYRQSFLPGDFRVEQANGALYVTPTKILGITGSQRAVSSPMLTRITLTNASRTIPDTAAAIFEALSKVTGLRFGLATFPFRPGKQVMFSADNEPAREVLARLFAVATSSPVSYRLLYSPKPDPRRVYDYMINVHLAGFVPPQASSIPGPTKSTGASPTQTIPTTNRDNPNFVRTKP